MRDITRQVTELTQKTEPPADMKAAYASALVNAGGNGARLRKSLDLAGVDRLMHDSPLGLAAVGEFSDSVLVTD